VEVRFEASFERDLKKLKDKRLLKNVKDIIDDIKKAQNLDEISNLSKLKGYKTFYRIRLGDYRIGIDIIEEETIVFTRILHRPDIYRYFP